jgi:hypothetical protein
MKYVVRNLFLGLMVLALAGVMAMGKDHDKVKRQTVTFPSNVTVNGTVVKAGDYDLKFDEQTGALEILKGGKVIAKTTARLEPRTDKSRETRMTIKADELVSIAFGSDDLVISQGNPRAGSE